MKQPAVEKVARWGFRPAISVRASSLRSFLPSLFLPNDCQPSAATINDGTVSFGGSSFNVERELASFSFLAEFPLSFLSRSNDEKSDEISCNRQPCDY